jgi:cation diffusion facilitator family transporter
MTDAPQVVYSTSTAGGNNAVVMQHAHKAVIWAMVFNFSVAALKMAVGIFLANSAALFSEGLHSLADGINSVLLLIGLTRGTRAPDRTHPFGYGLETNFWALLASIALFLSAGYAIMQGIDRIMNPQPLEHYWWAATILVVSILWECVALYSASKAVLAELGLQAKGFSVFLLAMKHIRLVVGPTTRFVFYEDGLAFLGGFTAFIAITLTHAATVNGWWPKQWVHLPDAIASVLIGVMLLVLALNLLRYNRGFLTGAAAPAIVEERIRNLVLSVPGVSQLKELKTIDQGLSGLIVHMTTEVDPEIPVKDVDDLTERIRKLIQRHVPTVRQVTIEVLADEKEEHWTDKFYLLIEAGKTQKVLRPREEAMLRKVVEFRELVARDVMVPRRDVEYVDIITSVSEVADLLIESGHSRLPVYEDHVDNLVGVVHAKDVYKAIRHGMDGVTLAQLVRDIDIYPENKLVSDLLEDFKRNKIHLAAVADEHGGFAGVVTIEDLMEEIVGDIWDDSQSEDLTLEVLTPNQVVVSGKYDSDELNDKFGWNIPTEEFKTIGGFVFGRLGREPEAGDTITFEGLTIQVKQVDGPRIITLTIDTPVPVSM